MAVLIQCKYYLDGRTKFLRKHKASFRVTATRQVCTLGSLKSQLDSGETPIRNALVYRYLGSGESGTHTWWGTITAKSIVNFRRKFVHSLGYYSQLIRLYILRKCLCRSRFIRVMVKEVHIEKEVCRAHNIWHFFYSPNPRRRLSVGIHDFSMELVLHSCANRSRGLT